MQKEFWKIVFAYCQSFKADADLRQHDPDPAMTSVSFYPKAFLAASTFLGELPMNILSSTIKTGRFKKVYSDKMYLR